MYEIDFSNYSSKKVDFVFNNILGSFKRDEVTILDTGNGIRVNPNEHVVIEGKYLIYIQRIDTPCSWIHYFGKSKEHGWGMKIFVNKNEVGVICANKTSILDLFVHARLVYNRDSKDNPFIQFYNTGWWGNSSIFPTKLNFEL